MTEINAFFSEYASLAPPSVGPVFWTSAQMSFFRSQDAIAQGVYAAVALSTAVAFLILLVSIRDVKMTFFATVSIFLTLATTLGALVLDGWQLNVSEAITMAVAIGMCVDFTVHFATSYQHAPRIHAPSRAQRVTRSMTEMGASVSVAAFTTFMAGCALLPSQVLFFFQFGEFLVLVMLFAWIFAVFFFQPLCAIWGAHYPAAGGGEAEGETGGEAAAGAAEAAGAKAGAGAVEDRGRGRGGGGGGGNARQVGDVVARAAVVPSDTVVGRGVKGNGAGETVEGTGKDAEKEAPGEDEDEDEDEEEQGERRAGKAGGVVTVACEASEESL